jgi:hypothetical protein
MHVPLLCLHYAVAISYLHSVETSRLTSRAVRVLPTILCIRCSLLGAGGRKSAWGNKATDGWMDASCGCMQFFFLLVGPKKKKANIHLPL